MHSDSVESGEIYDALYSWKDYRKEADLIHRLIQRHRPGAGLSLLDVACGTGSHISFLRRHYRVEGVDVSPRMLRAARIKNPGVPFHRGDMRTFDLRRRFDVVTCLFGSICYLPTLRALRQATENMARHVRPGGLLLVEPFITPQAARRGHISATLSEGRDRKVARMSVGVVYGRILVVPTHFLVGIPRGVRYYREEFRFSLFSKEEHIGAFETAGLDVRYYARGPIGRGLYVGSKAAEMRGLPVRTRASRPR